MPAERVRRGASPPRLRSLGVVPLLIFLSWRTADACTCPVAPGAIEALAMADAVFVGTVVDQRAYVHVDGMCTGPALEYDLVVHRAWKGVSEPRVTLRRIGPCDPSFGVGTASLVYAVRCREALVASGCLRTAPLDQAADDIPRLGAPTVAFALDARPVATSLPVSRRLRAYVVAGVGVHAHWFTNRDVMPPSWDRLLPPAIAALLVILATVALLRRRWRTGVRLLSCAVLTLVAHLLWTGHVFLRNEWNAAFLRW